MRLTYADGHVVERVFTGTIANQGDLERFVQEVQTDLKEGKVYCELWKEIHTTPTKERSVIKSASD